MVALCQRIAASRRFETAVLSVILLAGVLVGVETYPAVTHRLGGLMAVLDTAIILVFVAEVVIKIAAQGRHPLRYFADPWNVFDFGVVVVTTIPTESSFAAVFRLVRILRVLRLVKAMPRLRLIVDALIKSFSAMGYVSLLLFLHFYIFATLGVSLFGKNDPLHFGSLDRAFLTLFQLLTLDSWVDVMNIQVFGAEAAPFYQGKESVIVESSQWPIAGPVYCVVFVLLGTMIILNLFIGVITNSMSEAQAEQEEELLERVGVLPPDGVGGHLAGLPLVMTAAAGSSSEASGLAVEAQASPLPATLAALELQADVLKAELGRLRRQLDES